MSSINLNSSGGKNRRHHSNYTSVVIFAAAVAIALSAAVIRMRKDKPPVTDTPAPDTASTQLAATGGDTSPTASAESAPASAEQPKSSTPKQPSEQPSNTAPVSSDDGEELEDSEQTLAIQTIGGIGSYVRPVGGAVTKEFSIAGLVYSRTMGDWRVHNGLDLSAAKGELVKSAAEGTVVDIFADPLYGTTVVVNQIDGLMVYYRGLNKDTAVRQGENISAGTTLGTVGDIPCESGDGSHLHIEVKKDSGFVSPAELLGIQ